MYIFWVGMNCDGVAGAQRSVMCMFLGSIVTALAGRNALLCEYLLGSIVTALLGCDARVNIFLN